MTEGKVVGKRLGFWQGTAPWVLALIFVVCPLCVILSARFLIGLRHVPFGVIADDYFLQVGASIIGLIMGPIGIATYVSSRRAYVVVSACPACGCEAMRDFGDARKKGVWPIECGHCLAYLRVQPRKLIVREIPLDEPTNYISLYGIQKEQYVGLVPRRDDEDRTFAFVMPQMCAVCCAANAPYLSQIGTLRETAGKGALRGLAYPTNYVGKTTPAPKDDLDDANSHIQTPVCAAHKGEIAMERDGGYLWFGTYRYYREFCAANKITVGREVAAKTAAAATPA